MKLEKKIVEARKKGAKIADLSRTYHVDQSTISRLLRLERETGSVVPKASQRGRKPELDSLGLKKMQELIYAEPDITLKQIKQKLGLKMGIPSIHHIVKHKLNLRLQKKRYELDN